jgi:hypothetical protein
MDDAGVQNVGLREVQESVLTDHAASRRSEPAPAQTKPFACACVSRLRKALGRKPTPARRQAAARPDRAKEGAGHRRPQ